MDSFLGPLSAGLGTFGLFAGIALLSWVDQRGKAQRQQLEHAERMRALELGRPLGDAEIARAKALGAIGVATPICAFLAAVIATTFVLLYTNEDSRLRVPLLSIVWGVSGTVSLVGLCQTAGRLKQPRDVAQPEPIGSSVPEREVETHIQPAP